MYLEFLDFNIRGPSSGNCLNDTFTVTTSDGTATMLPILCGVNTGQSGKCNYLNFSSQKNTIHLNQEPVTVETIHTLPFVDKFHFIFVLINPHSLTIPVNCASLSFESSSFKNAVLHTRSE